MTYLKHMKYKIGDTLWNIVYDQYNGDLLNNIWLENEDNEEDIMELFELTPEQVDEIAMMVEDELEDLNSGASKFNC
jgi:hypothetical protein